MASKGTVYKEKGVIGGQELLTQLNYAMEELEDKMKASIPINKRSVSGITTIGYGVDKTQRGIAADSVISIAKAIKALKGW